MDIITNKSGADDFHQDSQYIMQVSQSGETDVTDLKILRDLKVRFSGHQGRLPMGREV